MPEVAQHYAELRPLMFSIAYRMVGSVSEAEDIVQEAFLRMHRERSAPDSPDAYAATVTTRLAIDHLRSARVRREAYVGPWLPEPLIAADSGDDPSERVELDESLSMAFLVVLESLSPVERAVFLLREVFDYDYADIARIVEREEANCRQLAARARAHVQQRKPRFEVSPARRRELSREFFAACSSGDIAGLERLLADDVVFYADNAGRPPAVRRPVEGRTQVARFVVGLIRQATAHGIPVTPTVVNGLPGARIDDADGNVIAVLSLHVADGRVHSLRNVLNPDKLRHVGPVGDILAVMSGRS